MPQESVGEMKAAKDRLGTDSIIATAAIAIRVILFFIVYCLSANGIEFATVALAV
jgi:hypothetical protein